MAFARLFGISLGKIVIFLGAYDQTSHAFIIDHCLCLQANMVLRSYSLNCMNSIDIT
jgi:hypothetical protein